MARGLSIPLSISTIFPFASLRHYRLRLHLRSCSCVCKCDSSVTDISKYREAFSRRMAMAGLKPHHRIALGVSGGPDSMALCVLSAKWKINTLETTRDCDGFIDGILAIIVDHGLRAESKDEASMVSRRVSEIGIRCEISQCEWLDGRPKQGHLQEAARDMRYQHFQKVCIQNHINVLLIAHHSDDQAELFVLRLSRDSGVLGLAGMPFVSQIFSSYTNSLDSRNCGILLVRPLLDFSKEDMYKICRGGEQNWVEDPTNQSLLYTRNRIRMSLRDYSSCRFNSELQAVISACQQTRLYVDYKCSNLIHKAVTVMDLGYAVIDLEILNQMKIEDIILSRFITLILQFVSQRNKPVRGNTSKLVSDYFHTFPCTTSLTAAGCYLCPAPASRGTKALVCYSVDHPLPQAAESQFSKSFIEQQYKASNTIEEIVARSKLCSDHLVPAAEKVHFLDMKSSSILAEAKRLDMVSDSTCEKILCLKSEEVECFRSNKTKSTPDINLKEKMKSTPISTYSEPLHSGEICSFMNRFSVTWKLNEDIATSSTSLEAIHDFDRGEERESRSCHCRSCVLSNGVMLNLRHMAESDWLYLANLSKSLVSENFQQPELVSACGVDEAPNLCSDHARHSAQKALRILKSIPAAARRGLPVLVNCQGVLLSVPSIGFQHCPELVVTAVFRPRVPLGGGYSLFV